MTLEGGAPTSADHALVTAAGEVLGVPLTPRTFVVRTSVRVGVDGAYVPGEEWPGRSGETPRLPSASAERMVLVQCAGGTGLLKSAHRNKVLADAFKLDWLRDALDPRARCVIALGPAYSRMLVAGAWLPEALRERRIETVLLP